MECITPRATKTILTKVENVVHDLPLLISRLPLGQPELGSTSTVPGLRLGLGLDGVVGNVRVVGDVGVGAVSCIAVLVDEVPEFLRGEVDCEAVSRALDYLFLS